MQREPIQASPYAPQSPCSTGAASGLTDSGRTETIETGGVRHKAEVRGGGKQSFRVIPEADAQRGRSPASESRRSLREHVGCNDGLGVTSEMVAEVLVEKTLYLLCWQCALVKLLAVGQPVPY